MPEAWWEYVQRISRGAPHKDIAAAAGVDPSRITGWKNGDRPQAQSAVAFARAYRRNPVEALIAAGYLDKSEVSGVVEVAASAARLSHDELLAEIRRRIQRPHEPQDWPPEQWLTPGRASGGQNPGMGGREHGQGRHDFGGQ